MIVVDCTVLADWAFGDEIRKSASIQLMERDPLWIAPWLIRYELGNVAWKIGRFDKAWKPELLKNAIDSASQLIHEYVTELNHAEALAMALEREITFYDATYAWLARHLDTWLYTRDGKLVERIPDLATIPPNAIG